MSELGGRVRLERHHRFFSSCGNSTSVSACRHAYSAHFRQKTGLLGLNGVRSVGGCLAAADLTHNGYVRVQDQAYLSPLSISFVPCDLSDYPFRGPIELFPRTPWHQGDAHPHPRPRWCRKNHYSVQATGMQAFFIDMMTL
jgi:hypothetical protein